MLYFLYCSKILLIYHILLWVIQLSRIDIYVAFSQNTLRANVTPLHYLDNSRDKSRKTRIFQRASYLSHIQINFKDKNETAGERYSYYYRVKGWAKHYIRLSSIQALRSQWTQSHTLVKRKRICRTFPIYWNLKICHLI